jgi:hypothetical protein
MQTIADIGGEILCLKAVLARDNRLIMVQSTGTKYIGKDVLGSIETPNQRRSLPDLNT